MKFRVIPLMLVVGLVLVSVAFAGDRLPAASNWNVFSGGQNIGEVSVSHTGNLFIFNDNPNTDHPPNTSGSWALNSEGSGYGNGQGQTTTFTDNGDGTYSW